MNYPESYIEPEERSFDVIRKNLGRRIKPSSLQNIIAKWDLLKIAKSLWLKVWKQNLINCPFHNEKTASFKLYLDSQEYHCHWCWAHWDIVRLVQEIKGISIIKATFYVKNICWIYDKIEFENNYSQDIELVYDIDNIIMEYKEYCNLNLP